MVRWLRWHCPPDIGFEIRALAVWGRARYLSVTILTFTRGWGRNNFVSFKPPRPGTEPRTLAWKAAVLTTTLGPPPWSKVLINFTSKLNTCPCAIQHLANLADQQRTGVQSFGKLLRIYGCGTLNLKQFIQQVRPEKYWLSLGPTVWTLDQHCTVSDLTTRVNCEVIWAFSSKCLL